MQDKITKDPLKSPHNTVNAAVCTFSTKCWVFLLSLVRINHFSSRGSVLRRILSPQLVDEFNNDVVLLNAHAVEMFAYGQGQTVLALPAGMFLARHCWRVQADAAWLR